MQQPINIDKKKPISFSLRQITEILIKHENIHEGLYNLSLNFKIAVGAVGPAQDSVYPGAMIGVAGVGILKVEKETEQTVDAAINNPLPITT